MPTVAILSKPSKPELAQLVPDVVAWLRDHDYRIVVDRESAAHARQRGVTVVSRDKIAARKPTFAIVLGGDGTMLAAARALAHAGIPILGVNLGSLGFLTEVPVEELFATLDAVARKRFRIEGRTMLRCEVFRQRKRIAEHEALNDAVVNKTHLARIMDFDVHIDGTFVSNYKADGIIVATPTGSTAYSLAAGGPILLPDANALVITPVSPHALTNRPLVVRDTSFIDVVVRATEGEAFLSIDGQTGLPLRDQDRVRCRKSQHQARLLRSGDRSFFDVLRTKLKWGAR